MGRGPSFPGLNSSSSLNGGSSSPGQASDTSFDDKKKRSRVFIDPLTEIPKLEAWFQDDTHPSSYQIEKYTDDLNMSSYRQRFPKLEPKNVQLWFKNHRAKVKRARQEQVALTQLNSQISPETPSSAPSLPLPQTTATI